MVFLPQAVLSLLISPFVQRPLQIPSLTQHDIQPSSSSKSIAIIGAGSAGLAALKTFLEVEAQDDWDIVLFEQRRDVGGIWCGTQPVHMFARGSL